jgi:hypothetical protein
VQADDEGVEPQAPMSELYALRAGSGPRGVVDGGRRVLLACPRAWLGPAAEDLGVVPARYEGVLDVDRVEQVSQLGVDQQDIGPLSATM